ncbi:hypothetical protein ABZP36_007418, partial [Zizania latifolia]
MVAVVRGPRNRVAFVLVDGIGDVTIPSLVGRTPLEAVVVSSLVRTIHRSSARLMVVRMITSETSVELNGNFSLWASSS